MVFSGVVGAPATGFPNPVYTTLDDTPLSREKPYLYLDSGGAYRVLVPSLRTNARGASWTAGSTPGVYHIDGTVNVNRADTVVLGLGYATIIPDSGVVAMKVADVDGVKIAGVRPLERRGCQFNMDPTIHAARGIETPVNPNVKFHSISTVSLGGNGVIDDVINTTGGPAQGTATVPSTVTNYP
jgi:hypothetical protein